MKKVLLVSNASWTMVKFRLGLMQKLKEMNYDVTIVSPYDEYSKYLKELDFEFVNIKIDNKGANPLKDLKLIYDLYDIYKKNKPDLVIHYTIKPNIFGSFASFFARTECISVIPGLGYAFINQNITTKIVKFLYKIALRIPKKVFFINKDDIKLFMNLKLVSLDKIEYINSEGINIEKFKYIDKKKDNSIVKFLLIARILKDKGIYEYFEAAKIIKKKYKNVSFQILGPIYDLNPTAIKLETIKEWENSGIIDYLGETHDVRDFIANSDCIVLPSYREGKGMTLVEGACMGKPLIATDVPGCRDVIEDGLNGYLCNAKDSKSLADKMKKIIELTEKERKSMGKYGREKIVREMDENIIIEKYLKVIKEILK